MVESRSITVIHNIEVAHRLTTLPGKCERIHGHSMLVSLDIFGAMVGNLLAGLDFGEVKKTFRGYLDHQYDHHLLLGEADPWAERTELPGLVVTPGDPTVENLAEWIGEWARARFAIGSADAVTALRVRIDETATNAATWEWTA